MVEGTQHLEDVFSRHRKPAYNMLLITQSDWILAKQIRNLVEADVKHWETTFSGKLENAALDTEKYWEKLTLNWDLLQAQTSDEPSSRSA